MTVREQFIVGIDLGGTNIAAGVMPTDGTREIAMRMIPTHAEEGAEAVVSRIAALIEDVIAQTRLETGADRSDFLGVGIGSPGPLDRAGDSSSSRRIWDGAIFRCATKCQRA